MIILIMGVCGVGKSTIGKQLSVALGAHFIDADDFHAEASRLKMQQGQALTDADREDWLARLAAALASQAEGGDIVLACSALKQAYRERLLQAKPMYLVVWLHGPSAMIAERLHARRGHFMHPTLLDSQLAILEPPLNAIHIRVDQSPSQIVAEILKFTRNRQ